MALTPLTTATFDETVSGSDRTVVVDFWAEWCPPCKALAPVLDELSAELADTHEFVSVDTEAHPALAERFQTLSLPTLLVFRDGQVQQRLVGFRGKQHLREELARIEGIPRSVNTYPSPGRGDVHRRR
jgi:thioredoxin 1